MSMLKQHLLEACFWLILGAFLVNLSIKNAGKSGNYRAPEFTPAAEAQALGELMEQQRVPGPFANRE